MNDEFTFGVYPGGFTGEHAGPPDDPEAINAALDELRGSRPLIVRAYRIFGDPGGSLLSAPVGFERCLGPDRGLDLVASYHSLDGDVDGYVGFLEDLIDRYGTAISTLQIGEEPNVTDSPLLDGWYPKVSDAIVAGVSAAKSHALRRGLRGLRVGVNTTPLFGPAAGFLAELTGHGGQRFIDDLDYIGLDFFPDVFRPLPGPRLDRVVEDLLSAHRREILVAAGLGHLPLIITEHGWPTGPGRTPERQAEVLGTVLEVISRNAGELNITGYIHHSLRDACSALPSLFCQFGLMTDDYVPKPAFGVYREFLASAYR